MSKTGIGLGILLGVAIGAGIGILVAPDKGSKTRGKIRGKVDEAKSDIGTKYDALKKKSHKHAEDAYKDLVSDLAGKSEDVVTFLEEKLAALKKEIAKY